jgi:hypothetical protein
MLKSILTAFRLTEDDLKQNRAGKLTTDQKLKLLKKLAESVILSGIMGFISFNFIFSLRVGRASILPLAIVALLLIALIVERAFRVFRIASDLVRGDISQIEERIQLQPLSRRSARMRVGEMKFRITAEQLLALRNEQRYTVYYTPRSRMLASVEPSELTTEGHQNAGDFSYELLPKAEKEKRTFRLGEDGELIADQDTQASTKARG